MRAQHKLYDVVKAPTLKTSVAQPMQGTLDVGRWFLPRRETRLVADEAQRTGGVFIPYPLLGIMLTLVLVLGGGIIGMYVKVDTMNSTLLLRDADQKDAIKELKTKLDLQEMYTRDIREKMAEMRVELNTQRKKS